MKFVLASHNRGKLAELQAILGSLGVEVLLEADLGLALEPEETGETFEENALIKARAVMEASGLPAIADDSGLCVDALGGAPGVHTGRYGGAELSEQERYTLLLNTLRQMSAVPRTAKFVSVVTCVFPNGDTVSARGECPGSIADAPCGEGGFGYDPVFQVPSLRKTFAQLTPEEKAAVSHRGNALRTFAGKLEEYLRENLQ